MGLSCTVIVATYGDERWVRLARQRAVPSADAQRPSPREVMHVHGPSLHEARNQGADLATGEWLCFLDADDELAAGYLAAMAAAAPERDALLAPAVQYVAPDGTAEPPRIIETGRPLEDLNRCVIGTLVRRDQFIRVGGFRDWPYAEDWDLWLRCTRAGEPIIDVAAAVYIAHRRARSRNRQPRHLRQRVYDDIRRQYV